MAKWDKGREIHLRLKAEQEGRQRRVIKVLTEQTSLRRLGNPSASELPGLPEQVELDAIPSVPEERLMKRHVYDEASEVEADRGEVAVDGPDGVALSLTPEAALETGRRLIEKSGEAAAQQHWRKVAAGPTDRRDL